MNLNLQEDMAQLLKTAEDVEVRLELLSTPEDSVQVWAVDGAAVRNRFTSRFIGGGHHWVYPWIPENEVWIEEATPEEDQPYYLLHELHERKLMQRDALDYDTAHARAEQLEDMCRDNPEILNDELKKAMEEA